MFTMIEAQLPIAGRQAGTRHQTKNIAKGALGAVVK
jgi:hypothetical protein